MILSELYIRADDGDRTRDLNLGKVPRYQLRYVRKYLASTIQYYRKPRKRNLSQFVALPNFIALLVASCGSVRKMEPVFWMNGKLATGLIEVSNELKSLTREGFWSLLGTFEGVWTLARFEEVTDSPFSNNHMWKGIEGEWESSQTLNEYLSYVEFIRNQISLGNVYQVNACRQLRTKIAEDIDLAPLMQRILESNPAPFASYLNIPGMQIASASPERFITVKNGEVLSSPIKGTSATSTFLEKDYAENLMIVDLIRNDLGRICDWGSIRTPRLHGVEEHPGLFHLVSDITGTLRQNLTMKELLDALMPPGSVSGAPKTAARKIISEREKSRGPYCGAMGYSFDGEIHLAVGIRTFWSTGDGFLYFGTGAGITWGSEPLAEWEETELKARKLIGLTR